MIIRILTICFEQWLRPILFFGITAVLFIVSLYYANGTFQTTSFWLSLISMAGLFFSFMYQLYKKRWLTALITMIVFGIWSFFLVYVFFLTCLFINAFFGSLLFTDMPDENSSWKSHLEIPDNILLNDPIITSPEFDGDSVKRLNRSHIDFELYTSFQPGIYKYHFWTAKIDSGIIYLKAFEITQEYALSADRLPKQSEVNIYNSADSLVRVGATHDFTIYEGDWGDPYAARFEVWFKPKNGVPERKLFEKNYKIEGWQR